jgi:hypothetical protein
LDVARKAISRNDDFAEFNYRWTLICPTCYGRLDSNGGGERFNGMFFTLAGRSRSNKARTFTRAKYEAYQQQQARKLGVPLVPFSSAVMHLARALSAGETGAEIPLIDALIEAGHPQLAEFFRAQTWHARSSWALDFILSSDALTSCGPQDVPSDEPGVTTPAS